MRILWVAADDDDKEKKKRKVERYKKTQGRGKVVFKNEKQSGDALWCASVIYKIFVVANKF